MSDLQEKYSEIQRGNLFKTAKDFENRVREVMDQFVKIYGITVDFNPHPHVFPDIAVDE